MLGWERKSESRVSGVARGLPHWPLLLHTIESSEHVTAILSRGLGVMQWCLESLKRDVLLFWDLLRGLRASGLTHSTGLGAGQGVTALRVTHAALGVPAQPAGDQPGLVGQGE